MKKKLFFILMVAFFSAIMAVPVLADDVAEITVTSPDFEHGKKLPKKCSCDGGGTSPALEWSGLPEGTKSLAVICTDPDSKGKTWIHWVIYNIPGDATGLPEAVPMLEELPDGTRQGKNSWKRIGYGGACPPSGSHRYNFYVYALDTVLDLDPGAQKGSLKSAMDDHILGEGKIMGRYR